MKKIGITFLALILPLAVLTADDICYDNPTKTVLMDLVVQNVNADNILFATMQGKSTFLNLCDQLYSYRDACAWSNCVSTASSLNAASENISNLKAKMLVKSIFENLEDVYGEENYMVVSDNDFADISDALMSNNPKDYQVQGLTVHFAGCDSLKTPDGIKIHFSKCSNITQSTI
ncbi:hypothetical protein GX441_12695 [bacterium]|nr:hypothetical protein [bacterium]